MDFKSYLQKLQNLPEGQKKIVLLAIVAVVAIIMGFFWVKSVADSLPKIGEAVKNLSK